MKQIPLNGGGVALVDDEDYDRLSAYRWNNQRGYASRSTTIRGKWTKIWMHHEVLHAGTGMQLDHVDRNGLNNKKSNLRQATRSQNMRNRRGFHNSTSKFKGVSWHKGHDKWHAQIRTGGRTYHIGYFESEQDAALAYNAKAVEMFGEFAFLNAV